MKVAIMQPYFFPYLGYFDLIYSADLFIVYDTVQYIKQGWINRNRVLHPKKNGWLYISVPVNKNSFHSSYQTPILDIEIANEKPWRQRILAQIMHYSSHAPYFVETMDFVKECLDTEQDHISKFNAHVLMKTAKLLDLNFRIQFCSELNINLDSNLNAQEQILHLCEVLGAKEYGNLPGGINLYHPEDFRKRNIKLTFHKLPPLVYSTSPYTFEPSLSIVDLLMWNRPQTIKGHLDSYHRAEENND